MDLSSVLPLTNTPPTKLHQTLNECNRFPQSSFIFVNLHVILLHVIARLSDASEGAAHPLFTFHNLLPRKPLFHWFHNLPPKLSIPPPKAALISFSCSRFSSPLFPPPLFSPLHYLYAFYLSLHNLTVLGE